MMVAIHSAGQCQETGREYNSFLKPGTILFAKFNEANFVQHFLKHREPIIRKYNVKARCLQIILILGSLFLKSP